MEFQPVVDEDVDGQAVSEKSVQADRHQKIQRYLAGGVLGGVLFMCIVAWRRQEVKTNLVSAPNFVGMNEEDHHYTDTSGEYSGTSGLNCTVGSGRICAVSELSQTEPTTIFPGGDTTCIWGHPYGFTYYPGDADKLLVFFGGGAACWKSPTGDVFLGCRQVLPEVPFLDGIWDSTDSRNPFASHQKLYIHYCSGDVHTGSATDTWDTPQGERVAHFNGFKNVMSALTWAKTNLAGGGPNGQLSNLLIGGSSAGAFATMIWSGYVIDLLPSESAAAFYDSSTGYTPPGSIPYLFKHHWGSCPTQVFINGEDSIQAKDCADDKADLIYLPGLLAAKYPNVIFAVLEPKEDHVQRGLYTAMVNTFHTDVKADVSGPDLYSVTNSIYAANMAQAKCANYVVFYADADNHCFVLHDNFYSATTGGENGEPGLHLTQWMAPLAFGVQPEPLVACKGTVVSQSQPNGVQMSQTIQYCDAALTYQSRCPSDACGCSTGGLTGATGSVPENIQAADALGALDALQ